jgi:DNA helicase HerA-like ATPase
MGSRPGDRIGIIYGEVEATEFRFAASDPDVKRLDYVIAQHPAGLALGQIVDVQRHSQLTFDEAVGLGRHGTHVTGDHVSCTVRVIGYRDERGLLQLPRTPFKAGMEIRRATSEVLQKVLGLTSTPDDGVYLGFLKGTEFPVVLDIDALVQKHASVLAKTGAGKSYTVGVIIEELIKKKVALVIVDPHGEYGTLASPNIEPKEIDQLIRFGLKPKSFATSVTEYALDTRLVQGAKKLTLAGSALEAAEIFGLLAGKVSSAQQGLLYQAINNLRKTKPHYVLKEIVEELGKNPSNAKWPLIAALENLDATGLFSAGGTGFTDLVKSGHAALLNLKGASPEVQEIVVARLTRSLFDARKRNSVPPFLFVVEEAHNFCPERGIGAALSGPELRTVASEGRKFGMGLLIVSQRPAKVDKNVLSQCNTQIMMKVTNPNDLKAITHSVEGLTGEAAEEIQQLGTGVGLVAGGKLATPILVEIRTRQTRHGGKSVSVIVDEDEDAPLPPAATEVTEEEAGPAAAPPAAHAGPEPFVNVEEAEPEALAAAALPPPPLAPTTGPVRKELREAHPLGPTKTAPWGPQVELPAAPPRAAPERPQRRPEAPEIKPRPESPAPRYPEPEHLVAPTQEPDELAVQRVIARVGIESAKSPREAVLKVREIARSGGTLSPEDAVRAYAKIGRTYCYASMPECGPCPLLHQCRLGGQRLARGEVKQGKWGQKPK